MKITDISAREVLDSRGFPTVFARVTLSDGSEGCAMAPSGASTGSHEALELRDSDETRYQGKGVLRAVKNVDKIAKELACKNIDIQKVDELMLALDGTPNKTVLGANAMLAVSLACARAFAAAEGLPLYKYIRRAYGLKEKSFILPTPMLNIVNGGKHADSGLAVQEFMIVPQAAPSFEEALRQASEVYHTLKKELASSGMVTAVGDEGGFAPKIASHEEVLNVLLKACADADCKKMALALDCAASEFYKDGRYNFEGRSRTYQEMSEIYASWCQKYPLVSIEDPLFEDDWQGWRYFTQELGSKINIVGDDLFVTNPARLKDGVELKAANSILIKLNQIGTLSETVKVINMAKAAGFTTIISHRSGETEDTFIADLAVAVNAGAIKTGAPARSERVCKYNRLLAISDELGSKAVYAGNKVFKK